MQQIGYSLIKDGAEVSRWGDTLGSAVSAPDVIVLANGDRVHAAKSGDILGDGSRLVPRYGQLGSADSVSVQDDKVVATFAVRQDAVIAERERRLALGFDYDFGDERGVHRIGTTAQDMKGWGEVTMASQAAIALGQPSASLSIVTNTGPVAITAIEWQQILLAATQFRQPIWAKSFALQNMSPIPADYASDGVWV